MSSSYFEFHYIHMQNGSSTAANAEVAGNPAHADLSKTRFWPHGILQRGCRPQPSYALIIFSYPSLAEMEARWGKLNSDPDYAAAVAEVEKDEPAFYRMEAMLLRATSFCPPFVATPAGDPPHKLYELRIYESPTNRQLGYLHDRFGAGEIDIFHKSGIHPILYADTVFGPNQPNMAYLIPFESESHREKAWAAFRANPDWIKFATNQSGTAGTSCVTSPTCFLRPRASRCCANGASMVCYTCIAEVLDAGDPPS